MLEREVERRDAAWSELSADESSELSTILEMWRVAAEKNHPGAQCNMGLMFKIGRGCEVDYDQAAHWYGLGAENGNANAQYNMGLLCSEGRGGLELSHTEAYR